MPYSYQFTQKKEPMSTELRRKRIRARLAERDMTAATLSKTIKISEGYTSRIINGTIDPTTELASKIANALGSTPAYLNLK